jgi:hypothetical protein
MLNGADKPAGTRSRSPHGAKDDGNDASAKEISALVAAQIEQALPEMSNKMCAVVLGSLTPIIGNTISAQVATQIAPLQLQITDTNTKVDALGVSVKTLVDKFEHLALPAAPCSSAPPGSSWGPPPPRSTFPEPPSLDPSFSSVFDVASTGFYRKLDPTTLFVNLHDRTQVPKTKFATAIERLAEEANIKSVDYKIIGDALDNRFEIKFLGGSANAKTAQFYQSLQLGRGKWKDQFVDISDTVSHQFYVAPDKNPCQVRKEVLAKALKNIIAPLLPQKDVYLKRATGAIYVDKRVLATIHIVDEIDATINWSHTKRIQLALDQKAVEQEFLAQATTGEQKS